MVRIFEIKTNDKWFSNKWPIFETKKIYDPNSKSTAELRCSLPHPTKSVIPIKRDAFGTDFVCLCCRTEFRLPKMAFYEAGVNSMLTGFCFIGQHTQDASEIGKFSTYFRYGVRPEVRRKIYQRVTDLSVL